MTHRYNYHEYYSSPDDHEYKAAIPGTEIVIRVSKAGGGTTGSLYDGNWAYSVTEAGAETMHGDDLVCGTPHSHYYMARTLANFLAAKEIPGSPHYEALAAFAENRHPVGDCELCWIRGTLLVATLDADPDERVCAECHADPRVATSPIRIEDGDSLCDTRCARLTRLTASGIRTCTDGNSTHWTCGRCPRRTPELWRTT